MLSSAMLALALVAAPQPINDVLPCGQTGTVGGLGAGTDLTRHTIDTSKFPNAVCNDGTPAIFYYAPATRTEDRNNWVIFLQGGGACNDGQSCAERWCHVNTNYGMDKMTSSLSKPAIRGNGFLAPRADNRFGTWNRVLIFYCSSDTWTGTKSTVTQASSGTRTAEFELQFRGSQIIDAVLDTLRNASPANRRRVVTHSLEPAAAANPWPDLDSAKHVLFAGSSAGGIGAKMNADRVAAKLRATNPNLVQFGVIIDASYSPDSSQRDYVHSTYCSRDPRGCSYEGVFRGHYEGSNAFFGSRRDESCITWHAPSGTEWQCDDSGHVTLHHLTTPFFVHQDLQDPQVGGDFVDAGFGTMSDYAIGVESELRALPAGEEVRAAEPGIFAPQCTDHESFTNDAAVYEVKIEGVSYYEAAWNWWSGAQPQKKIVHFTQPGKVPGCPSE